LISSWNGDEVQLEGKAASVRCRRGIGGVLVLYARGKCQGGVGENVVQRGRGERARNHGLEVYPKYQWRRSFGFRQEIEGIWRHLGSGKERGSEEENQGRKEASIWCRSWSGGCRGKWGGGFGREVEDGTVPWVSAVRWAPLVRGRGGVRGVTVQERDGSCRLIRYWARLGTSVQKPFLSFFSSFFYSFLFSYFLCNFFITISNPVKPNSNFFSKIQHNLVKQ
jgi:hypothetical protein